MRTHTFTIFILFGLSSRETLCAGQNLVTNPSFENFTLCPSNISQIDRAIGWSVFCGSPDYFNACNTNDSVDVPGSAVGYQPAFEGQAYAGICNYRASVVYRECIQSQLSAPLPIGQTVYLSMRVSPGGFGNDPPNTPAWTTSKIGMRFSTTQLSPALLIENDAALYLDQVLLDTAEWTLVSGDFVPDSAYEYIQIGNFFADAFSDPTPLDPNGMFNGSYAFVDEVCVSTEPSVCAIGNSIPEQQEAPTVLCSNPFGDELIVRFDPEVEGPRMLRIVDTAGRVCHEAVTMENVWRWNASGLACGYYVLRSETPKGRYSPLPLIHVSP